MHVVVLSPHRDDAAFSCGVVVHELLSAGNDISIVNVCAVSRYAPYVAANDEDAVEQITRLRLQEDLDFVQRLRKANGCRKEQIALLDLNWLDLPLRWRTDDAQSLAAAELRTEEVNLLERQFTHLPSSDLVLVPMALGGHLDHRLVHEAAVRAFRESTVLFYEDLPYACRMSTEECESTSLPRTGAVKEAWLPMRQSPLPLKRDYAGCYPSQIAGDVVDEIHAYTSGHGGRERFVGTREAIQKLEKALQEQEAFA